MNDSISIIIPALNEENNLLGAVDTVTKAAQNHFNEHEIIIVNDGSHDKTGEIANQIAKKNPHVKVIHHAQAKGLGGCFKAGLQLAKMDYFMRANGKNDFKSYELEKIFRLRNKADLVIPFTLNMKDRPLKRQIISKTFTAALNIITGYNLHYYNHYALCKRKILNSITISTDSYAFQAEILIKLLKRGHSYAEIGVNDVFRKDVRTKAFHIKNILGVLVFLPKIFYWRFLDRK